MERAATWGGVAIVAIVVAGTLICCGMVLFTR